MALAMLASVVPAHAGAMEDLVAAAQKEGELTVIALPHDWCGYGKVIDGFKAKYGLKVNELNPDAGSADELLADVLGLLDAQPLSADYGDPDAPAGGSAAGGADSATSPEPVAGGGGPFALGFGHSFLSRRRKSEKM